MTESEVQHNRDYNRGVPHPPPRGVGGAVLALHQAIWPAWAWTMHSRRRIWIWPLILGAILAALVGRFDGRIVRWLDESRVPALVPTVTYGALLLAGFGAFAWSRDPIKRQRLADALAGFVATFAVCTALSLVVGRPRPKFADPAYFIGPFGEYPLGRQIGVRHSWEFWVPGVSDLWSMPSREAAYAMLGAVLLGAAWPRAQAVARIAALAACAAVVGVRGHYPSDVVIGATIGAAMGRAALAHRWGRKVVPNPGTPG